VKIQWTGEPFYMNAHGVKVDLKSAPLQVPPEVCLAAIGCRLLLTSAALLASSLPDPNPSSASFTYPFPNPGLRPDTREKFRSRESPCTALGAGTERSSLKSGCSRGENREQENPGMLPGKLRAAWGHDPTCGSFSEKGNYPCREAPWRVAVQISRRGTSLAK
jgi:hypothetical protein